MYLFPTKMPKLDRPTWIGLAPRLMFFAITALLLRLLDPLNTNFEQTIEGLETRSIYARQDASAYCAGDVVEFHETESTRIFFRNVSAVGGQVFSLTMQGYAIDDAASAADENWLAAAQVRFGDRSVIKVPENHYLIINSEFGRDYRSNEWAFDVVPLANIRKRVTHILVSRDLSRIGSRVGPDPADC